MASYCGRNNLVITTIFFDLDNTLIETRKGDNLACKKLTEELMQLYQVDSDTSTKITSTYLKQFRKCPDNSAYDLDTWRTTLWSKALGDKYSYLSKKIYERWLYLRYHYLGLTIETKNMLIELRKKYLIGLISNGPSKAQWEKINQLNLSNYFDVILVSGDLPWEKPEPKIFYEACRLIGSLPHNCIMVGDKLETDILGGIEAGLAGTVWLPISDKTRLTPDDPKPGYTIKRITDLMTFLKRRPDGPELEDSCSNASDGS
ncbi:N-acylneuraminate-9-phosphatase isoform X1 [Aphidius gifuensis]|nr:N-acylneuraminate-9-phosphatase isoform X1 [Aphidius gifuensis]XP_044013308.1 N-acylneuraminate-9-phosphatase isoform X1 [Aphidius gifuensis]